MLDSGSGDGVTAARTAVLPPWAAKATAAPSKVANSCCSGESCFVASKARRPATGTRTKVCRAFQIRSKAGTLSAKNSTRNKAVLAAITSKFEGAAGPLGAQGERNARAVRELQRSQR